MARSLKPMPRMSVLLILAVAFTVGIGMGWHFPLPWLGALTAVAWGMGQAEVAILRRRAVAVSFIALFFVLGWARPIGSRVTTDEAPHAPCTRVVEGVVTEPPIALADHQRLDIALVRWSKCLDTPAVGALDPISGPLYIWIDPTGAVDIKRGEGVRLRARIKPIVPRRNPGSPRWTTEDQAYSAVISSGDILARISSPRFAVRRDFDGMRRSAAQFFSRSLPPAEAALARALMLGEAAVLDYPVRSLFIRTGTAHLLAVSGLNLGLMVMFVMFLTTRVLLLTPLAARTDVGRLAAVIAIAFSIGFTLFTGCRTPVVRACIMTISALSARVLARERGTAEALALAGGAILCIEPGALVEPDFQLSFAAVMGFLYVFGQRQRMHRVLSNASPERKGFSRVIADVAWYLHQTLIASAAASSVTTPILLYHFGSVSLMTIPANLVAVPLTGFIIMPLLFIAMTIGSPLPLIGEWLCVPLYWSLVLLACVLKAFSALPCMLVSPGPVRSAGIVTLSMALLLLAAKRRGAGFPVLAAGVLLLAVSYVADPPKIPPDALTVDFLDVGQGDSALVTFPNGETLLVDAGGTPTGRFDVGEQVVVPALQALGVDRLDTVAITHPDYDHIGGMPAVLESFEVGALWETGQGEAERLGNAYEAVRRIAGRRAIPIRQTPALCGAHRIGAVTVTVLHPCYGDRAFDPTKSFNANSIVLLFSFKNVSIALVGDIDAEVEERLAQYRSVSGVDVLKLAHHGSRSASSEILLNAWKPAFGVVSVGSFNPHGMPHPDVLRRFAAQGIRLLRTDKMGALRVTTDGRQIDLLPLTR